MINSKPIFVKMNGDWIPATECDMVIKIEGGSVEDFYRVWPTYTLESMLETSIINEEYEQARIISNILKER